MLILFNYLWWCYFRDVQFPEEFKLFRHGSIGREAVAIQSNHMTIVEKSYKLIAIPLE